MPEVTMALMESGAGRGVTRAEVLNSIGADLGFDICFVTMTRMFTHPERPYPDTRKEVVKMFTRARNAKGISDLEAVQRTVARMAKYRQRKEARREGR